MKKIYMTPELEIRRFVLTADILERSGEIGGEQGGGGLGGEGGETLPNLDDIGD